MPNCRKLELTIRQQASIVYALDGYGASDALTIHEKGEIIDLIRLIQSADVLAVEFASGRLPHHTPSAAGKERRVMDDHWTDHAAEPVFNTRIPATGPDGNIFAILGNATRMLREIDIPQDRIDRLRENVMGAASYDQAVAFVERWFPVDRGDEDAA